MADKKMSEMATDSTVTGTERLLSQAADGEVILVSAISAYAIADLIDSAAGSPVCQTGDYLLGFRGTTAQKMALDTVADYVQAYLWTDAATVTPLVSGDLLLLNRSGVFYDCNVDTLTTYVTTGVQATVLNTSALGAASLAATDKVPICVAGTPTAPKTATLTALTTYLDAALVALGTMQTSACAYLKTYLGTLSARTVPDAADTFYVTNGGTAFKMTLDTIAEYCVDATYDLPWQLIPSGNYVAQPTTTSTLSMGITTGITIGDPVKFIWDGTTYYGIVTAVGGSSSITIAGAPFSTTIPLTALYVGTPGQVKTITYWIDDVFGDAVQDLLSLNGRYDRWEGRDAYLVAFSATSGDVDTGAAQPKINVKVGGVAISTYDTNKGLQLSGTIGTWTDSSAVAINVTDSNYRIERKDAIEVACTEAGTNGDAADLSITLTFVYE